LRYLSFFVLLTSPFLTFWCWNLGVVSQGDFIPWWGLLPSNSSL
jgi:hypothetical protein